MTYGAAGAPADAGLGPGTTVVGVIGIGDMGAGIARSVLRGGYPVVAHDLRPRAVEQLVAAGARAAGTVEELAASCDVACLVVVNDRQVEDVVTQLLRAPGRVRTVIVNSTVLPRTVMDLDERARAAGLALVDAPVSGGGEKGELGTLTVMIGGDEAAVTRCWPIFETMGSNLFHVGPVGAGSAGKLVNNLLSLGSHALQLEAMQLAGAYGISEDAVTRFVTVSAGDSRGIRTWGRLDRIRRTHTLAGTPEIYEIFAKDVRSAAVAAGHRSLTLPVAAVIGELIGAKMAARDRLLEAQEAVSPLPRCAVCNQELAAPFREAGTHPECRS
jgi:3-hydroxyisobutyrate dehydrogenase-like beta-hydroxyacid dehydrogenase